MRGGAMLRVRSVCLMAGALTAELSTATAWASETPPATSWIRQIGTIETEEVSSVVVDDAGNAFIGGSTRGSLGGPNAGPPGTYDAFIAKYSASGDLLWIRQFGTSDNDTVGQVALDGAGNIFIGGSTDGSFGGPNAGFYDAYIAKYSASGDLLWIRQLGTSSYDYGISVAVDCEGNAFISGRTLGSLGGHNAGNWDAFIAKFSASGDFLWARQLGTNSTDYAYEVAIDYKGNAFMCGQTWGSLGGPNAGISDVFIAKYSASGDLFWTRQLGTNEYEEASSVAVDGDGNTFISGYTYGSLGGQNAGSYDAFIAKYSASGDLLWTRQLGTNVGDGASSVAVDGAGNAFISGTTYGSLGGPNAGPPGTTDAFIAKFSASGDLSWMRQIGTSSLDYGNSVTVDSADNVFTCGSTDGSLGGPNVGSRDGFIAKFERSPKITGDLNGDGVVSAADLGILLGAWGNPGCGGATPCPADLNGDGAVGAADLGILLGNWG